MKNLPRPSRILLLGVMINRTGNLVQLFLALYATSLGFSPTRAGILLSLYSIGAILGVLVGGRVSDRSGPAVGIVLSMTGSACATGLLAVLHLYPELLALSFCCGAFGQLYRPAALALLSQQTPPKQLVVTTAMYRLALNVGTIFAPLCGVVLVHGSYTLLFVADAATSAGFAAVALFALPDRQAGSRQSGHEESCTVTTAKRDARFLMVLGGMALITILEAQAQSTVPLRIVKLGDPAALYAGVLMLNSILVVMLELPVTPRLQRLPINVLIAAGAGLTGLGFAMFDLPGGSAMFIVATVIWTAGEIMSAPSVNAYPVILAPANDRGRYISRLSASQSIGSAIGPAIGTALYQFSASGMWIIDILAGGISAALMYYGVVVAGAPATRYGAPQPVRRIRTVSKP